MDSPSISTDALAIPSGCQVAGSINVPASKSATHRALNMSVLARRPVLVERPLFAEDTELFLAALAQLGWHVDRMPAAVQLTPGLLPTSARLFCGNAGTMLRFLIASLSTQKGDWLLDGTPRLRERPVAPLLHAVRALGGVARCLEREGYAPVEIVGGNLQGGRVRLDAGESSQYLSALLMAGTCAPRGVEVELVALTSEPYVNLTVQAIERFGGRVERLNSTTYRVGTTDLGAARILVEGDDSAACYPAAAAALAGGCVRLTGLTGDSRHGDRRFIGLLESMGAQVRWRGDTLEVERGDLVAVQADLSGMPDQVPTLAALAPFARGVTSIRNVPHLRVKESDRLHAMASGLRALGASVEEHEDGLSIPGNWASGEAPQGEVLVDSYGDHRVAMSFALVGLRRPGLRVRDPSVVGKSYPDFWRDFFSLLR